MRMKPSIILYFLITDTVHVDCQSQGSKVTLSNNGTDYRKTTVVGVWKGFSAMSPRGLTMCLFRGDAPQEHKGQLFLYGSCLGCIQTNTLTVIRCDSGKTLLLVETSNETLCLDAETKPSHQD